MDNQQIILIQSSFAQVAPIADKAAELFYNRLFELDPSLRPMFKSDMKEQKHKLMATLAFAIAHLKRPHDLIPAVEALGRKHAAYRVTPEHYNLVGAALLWTLEQGLGPEFTPEVKAAWAAMYTVLANTMQQSVEMAPM